MSGKAILQLARRILELRTELERLEKEWEDLFPGDEDDPEPDTLPTKPVAASGVLVDVGTGGLVYSVEVLPVVGPASGFLDGDLEQR